jgi:PAS domain S-box-containing protein
VSRISRAEDVLVSYALGQYDLKIPSKDTEDPLSGIFEGINMLGEELKERTVSRDYFKAVFDSIPNMIFLTNENGIISDCNLSSEKISGHERVDLLGKDLFKFLFDINNLSISFDPNLIKNETGNKIIEAAFLKKDLNHFPVSISPTYIKESVRGPESYIFLIRDITEEIETKRKVLKAIIDTQEEERKRISDELHDSVGQSLAAVRMNLKTVENRLNKKDQQALNMSSDLVSDVIKEIREICYNQMPSGLTHFGFWKALEDLRLYLDTAEKIELILLGNPDNAKFLSDANVSLFRVCQEFIHNSIKHSGASVIKITCNETDQFFLLELCDNGKGFQITNEVLHTGKGLTSIGNRISFYRGQYRFTSVPNKGTKLKIKYPIKSLYI